MAQTCGLTPSRSNSLRLFRRRGWEWVLALGWIWLGLIGHGFAADPEGAASVSSPPLPDGLYAEFHTARGDITAELFFRRAPLTVANFVGLAEGALGPKPGARYYDGLTFHRVVPGFVAQGGAPTSNGEGGPGYTIPDEFAPGLSHDRAGILSMANDGLDSNGSQFFFTLAPTPRLDYLHSIFGCVVRGLEVLSRIQQGDTFSVKIVRVGKLAEAFQVDRASFEALIAKQRAAFLPVGDVPFFEDPDGLLPTDPPRARNFNNKLLNVARSRGIRIFARAVAQGPSSSEEREAIAALLLRRSGAERESVAAVYFSDADAWAFSLGDEAARRVQRSFGGADLVSAREKLQEQMAVAFSRWAAEHEQAHPGVPLTLSQRVKLKIDALAEALILRWIDAQR